MRRYPGSILARPGATSVVGTRGLPDGSWVLEQYDIGLRRGPPQPFVAVRGDETGQLLRDVATGNVPPVPRLPGISLDEAERHYLEYHVPLARRLPGLRHYVIGKAAEFGYETVDVTKTDVMAFVKAKTGVVGPDVVLECAGTAQTIVQAVWISRSETESGLRRARIHYFGNSYKNLCASAVFLLTIAPAKEYPEGTWNSFRISYSMVVGSC